MVRCRVLGPRVTVALAELPTPFIGGRSSTRATETSCRRELAQSCDVAHRRFAEVPEEPPKLAFAGSPRARAEPTQELSDDVLGLEVLQVARGQAQPLGIDSGIVLAEQR